jgi:S1-C subfamily serine protease
MMGVSFGEGLGAVPTKERHNLTLARVLPGSPAEKAGLASGDVVTRVARRTVNDIDDLQLIVSMLPPETLAEIEYEREGRSGTTRLKLAKLATYGKKIVTAPRERWQGMSVDYASALDTAELLQAMSHGNFDEEGCVLVTGVDEGSVAWNAGVRPGMFVSRVGGTRVATPAEFFAAAEKVGDKFEIQLSRANTEATESKD